MANSSRIAADCLPSVFFDLEAKISLHPRFDIPAVFAAFESALAGDILSGIAPQGL